MKTIDPRIAAFAAAFACALSAVGTVSAQPDADGSTSSSDPADRIRGLVGFEPELASRFDEEWADGSRLLVASIARRHAARVGCSDLALVPFVGCSAGYDGGGAAIVVATDDASIPPFALAMSREYVVSILSVDLVAVDADEAAEIAIVLREERLEEQYDDEGEVYDVEAYPVASRLLVLDADGTVFLDTPLLDCELDEEYGYDGCDAFSFTMLDEDRNGSPELRVAFGVGADTRQVEMRTDRARGDETADEELLDLEDSVRYFDYRAARRRFVRRDVAVP